MKKVLLFAVSALLALPMITSCGGPSGNPQKDAEDFKDLYKEIEEIKLKIEKKKLEVLEYYADKKDKAEYQKFLREVQEVKDDTPDEFRKDNEKKFKELEDATNKAIEKFSDKSSSSDDKD